jgi:hypothetical protein
LVLFDYDAGAPEIFDPPVGRAVVAPLRSGAQNREIGVRPGEGIRIHRLVLGVFAASAGVVIAATAMRAAM